MPSSTFSVGHSLAVPPQGVFALEDGLSLLPLLEDGGYLGDAERQVAGAGA
jgi:hypothetical protein